MEISTKTRSRAVFYIKFTHYYIQITFLQELKELLLRGPVWLLERAITQPFLHSFPRQCGLLGEVALQPSCSPSCSWLTAHNKSLVSGCRLHPSFAKQNVQLSLEWKSKQLHLGLWKSKRPSIFSNLPSGQQENSSQLITPPTAFLCFTHWVLWNTITAMSCSDGNAVKHTYFRWLKPHLVHYKQVHC